MPGYVAVGWRVLVSMSGPLAQGARVICWATNGPFEAGKTTLAGGAGAPGRAVRALLVPVGGPPEVVDLAGGGGLRFMRSLRALIGAECVERIWLTDRWEFWLDEDGAAAGKPVNQAATLVARAFGARFSLRGAVVVAGLDKDADAPAALSPGQVDAILRRITGAP